MENEKVILITGASSGIGFDAARALVEQGHKVYGTSRQPEEGGYGFEMLSLDVTSDESVQQCFEALLNDAGRLDVLVNNAGVGLRGAIEESSLEDTRAIFETNVYGVLRMCQKALPVMRERGDGMIINISSIVGLISFPFNGIYSASKFALEGLTQALRMEAAQFGIKVATVNPGLTVTKFAPNAIYSKPMPEYKKMWEAGQERIQKGMETGPGPDIVSEAILEIIEAESPEANYIIGEDSSKLLDSWNELKPEEFTRMISKIFGL